MMKDQASERQGGCNKDVLVCLLMTTRQPPRGLKGQEMWGRKT
jgi:hypothetical protein